MGNFLLEEQVVFGSVEFFNKYFIFFMVVPVLFSNPLAKASSTQRISNFFSPHSVSSKYAFDLCLTEKSYLSFNHREIGIDEKDFSA